MHRANEVLLLAFMIFFMCLPVASAGTAGYFSQDWAPYHAYYIIYPGAVDVVGQTAYFGSHYTGPHLTNFLYAVNITDGRLIWRYNTTLPINFVSNFTYDGSTYIIVGTGDPTVLQSQGGYVLAFYPQKNMTFWPTESNLGASVQSLGTAVSNPSNNEDVIAGLANGQVVRLSGNNGSIQWRYNCAGNITTGNVPNIVQLDNGSVAVGTLDGIRGHVYCIEQNGSLAWSYTSTALRLVTKLGSLNCVVAASTDVIDVRNGTTGKEITPWPFNTTRVIPPFSVSQDVTDVLCTQDYTGDHFPDIVVSTDGNNGGFLMIIDGSNAALLRGPVKVSSYTLSDVQYMYSYENGTPLLNRTLAISIGTSSTSFYVCGVNASDLTVMKEFPVPGIFAATNLVNIENSTNFAGNVLFSAGNSVYCISGTEIVSEFPLQITLIIVPTLWISIIILKRYRPRIK